MRRQRPPDAAPVISARAEALPLDNDAVDAAMACVTIHHWEPPEAGLAELRRVARSRVVVFTFELDELPVWQQDYLADGLMIERPRFPSLGKIAHALGGQVTIERIWTPSDCLDGFFEAFWNRPEALLDPEVRASQSMWALLEPGIEQQIVDRLRMDLESGAWDAKYGYLREMASYDGALRLLIAEAG
jgi:SAM-dependent methyltransferase